MQHHVSHHNPILCLIPPYILSQIVQNGTPQQRAAAARTLAVDQTFRALRSAQPPRPTRGAPRRPSSQMVEVRKQRTIYAAHNMQTLPGDMVRSEGGPPTGDPAVDEAYDGLGATFDFYEEVYERNSIDDEGLHLDATVHFDRNYDNAFWDGQRMVFGDGDLFNRLTVSPDVIGHELTHGVTEDEAQLIYFNQSGALNEL